MVSTTTIPDSSDFALAAAAFTIEMWVRMSAVPTAEIDIIYQHNDTTQRAFTFGTDSSGNIRFRYSKDGTTWLSISSTTSFATDTWYFIAIERTSAGITTLTRDGVVLTTTFLDPATVNIFDSTAVVTIGGAISSSLTVWVDDLRITTGMARHGGIAFNVPTAAMPTTLGVAADCTSVTDDTVDADWASVVLYCNFNGSEGSKIFTDLTTRHDLYQLGNVHVQEGIGLYGQSGFWDGWIDSVNSSKLKTDFNFGTGDYTLEIAVNVQGATAISNSNSEIGLLSYSLTTSPYTSSHWRLTFNRDTGFVQFVTQGNGIVLQGTSDIRGRGWHRIAISRVSSTARLYVDGVEEDSDATGEDFVETTEHPGTGIRIGAIAGFSFSASVLGNIDEVRITKGVGRYSAAYTPRFTPFPTSA